MCAELSPNKNYSENTSNVFVADVLSRASSHENLENDRDSTLGESFPGSRKRKITFSKLSQLINEVPQEMDGKLRYLIIAGWSRELALRAEKIEPLGIGTEFKTVIKTMAEGSKIPKHGDIDYLWMVSEQHFNNREIWEKYSVDGGKSTAPVHILYKNDISRRQSGTLQPDPGALEKYCCKVTVNGREFIIPRPEVIFLEYSYYRMPRQSSKGIESDPNDINDIFWAKFIVALDKKYAFDLKLLEEARKDLIQFGEQEQKLNGGTNKYQYLIHTGKD